MTMLVIRVCDNDCGVVRVSRWIFEPNVCANKFVNVEACRHIYTQRGLTYI